MKDTIGRTEGFVKHIFQALIAWFTFFLTINWATLGWLAANFTAVKQGSLGTTVSIIFAWQNFLGISICCITGVYFFNAYRKIKAICASMNIDYFDFRDFPIFVYIASVVGMILAILPMFAFWVFAPNVFFENIA